ncbi:flagellar hook-associated protein FlgK [Metabacillus iocasae]|uniref:Flagellar hook-associated protein 1 n=1 Tax=Priestia iocasae TaxID=2291674 RepID=A0ABS2R138_9BACI|nr:flagellar hook-associated protein FlgK [Metabacillus iocasae]MBM7704464.1 flagellar hook-associated protein 1 FlgK [Metabacillus iocasae]
MGSTFHGLEVARRGMTAQQSALYTTGHNIANANTPGYTRQRVNFIQTEPYPAPSMNRPQIPGQMGTGVEAGSIQRVREGFLDVQYRGESNKLGYWEARSSDISRMEDIFTEIGGSGLSKVMDQFWQSLQDVSVNPENEGARAVVRQRGIAVADTFHYLNDSLHQVRNEIGSQIGVSVNEVNSILEQVAKVNTQINEIEPHGYLPNDLYDKRDQLVDQLSKQMAVKVTPVKPDLTQTNASPLAEGSYTISFMHEGVEYKLVEGSSFDKLSVEGGTDIDGDGVAETPGATFTSFKVTGSLNGDQTINAGSGNEASLPLGKLKALVESYGYGTTDPQKGLYPQMIDNMDRLAYSFGTLFNTVHQAGYGIGTDNTGKSFFDGLGTDHKGAAKSIKLHADIENDLKNIAISTENGESGNGLHAINLANLNNINLANGSIPLEGMAAIALPAGILQNGTLKTNYSGWVGKLGVDGQQAVRMQQNTDVLLQSVETRRQSISAVSLDEEMTNMIKFQHAYNAAARNMTVIDEMLDKIINGLGVGGR